MPTEAVQQQIYKGRQILVVRDGDRHHGEIDGRRVVANQDTRAKVIAACRTVIDRAASEPRMELNGRHMKHLSAEEIDKKILKRLAGALTLSYKGYKITTQEETEGDFYIVLTAPDGKSFEMKDLYEKQSDGIADAKRQIDAGNVDALVSVRLARKKLASEKVVSSVDGYQIYSYYENQGDEQMFYGVKNKSGKIEGDEFVTVGEARDFIDDLGAPTGKALTVGDGEAVDKKIMKRLAARAVFPGKYKDVEFTVYSEAPIFFYKIEGVQVNKFKYESEGEATQAAKRYIDQNPPKKKS